MPHLLQITMLLLLLHVAQGSTKCSHALEPCTHVRVGALSLHSPQLRSLRQLL